MRLLVLGNQSEFVIRLTRWPMATCGCLLEFASLHIADYAVLQLRERKEASAA